MEKLRKQFAVKDNFPICRDASQFVPSFAIWVAPNPYAVTKIKSVKRTNESNCSFTVFLCTFEIGDCKKRRHRHVTMRRKWRQTNQRYLVTWRKSRAQSVFELQVSKRTAKVLLEGFLLFLFFDYFWASISTYK